MPKEPPPVVNRYFEHDANRDIDAIVALFTDDATVIDEGVTRRGIREIRDWQTGGASRYQYTATVTGGEPTGPDSYRALARLDGNFPGNTVALKFGLHHDKRANSPPRDQALNLEWRSQVVSCANGKPQPGELIESSTPKPLG